jgi:hypothetical protein
MAYAKALEGLCTDGLELNKRERKIVGKLVFHLRGWWKFVKNKVDCALFENFMKRYGGCISRGKCPHYKCWQHSHLCTCDLLDWHLEFRWPNNKLYIKHLPILVGKILEGESAECKEKAGAFLDKHRERVLQEPSPDQWLEYKKRWSKTKQRYFPL